ncbi:MAG: ThuA domain-containing protein [Verrucomicrobia bacterium]|nr:ThuA domain-containing protein [Verrucomicrobiota bacterium]
MPTASLPCRLQLLALTLALAFYSTADASAADKKILLIAGPPSHGPGQHEHNAGVLLLQKCLAGTPGLTTAIVLNGWPKDAALLEGVDAVIIFADGGPRHIALQEDRLAVLERTLGKGAGLGLLHYAVEPTKEKGQAEFLKWIGGAFEIHWSVNPHWDANFKTLPKHPVARGVKPFTIRDEWYFNMRFVEGQEGVTPLLVAVPDSSTTSRPDGDHSGNATVRTMVARGDPQTVSWAFERANGGRGFGFTGAHFHNNWGNDNFRKLVLNAVLWLAKMEVPANGVESRVTPSDLAANLDPKPAKKAAPKK